MLVQVGAFESVELGDPKRKDVEEVTVEPKNLKKVSRQVMQQASFVNLFKMKPGAKDTEREKDDNYLPTRPEEEQVEEIQRPTTHRPKSVRWQEAIIDSSKGVGSKSQVREATFFGEGDDMNSQNVVRQRSVSWVTEVRASSALKCDKMCTVLRCAIVELSPLEKRDCIALMPALACRNLRIAETRTAMMMRPTIRVITRINGYDYRRPERKPRRALGQVFVSSPYAHIVTYAEVLLLSSLSTALCNLKRTAKTSTSCFCTYLTQTCLTVCLQEPSIDQMIHD
jgi:hypothetical protein